MSELDKLLSQKKPPGKNDIDLNYEVFLKLFWKCKGLLKNQERNSEFWEATNENLSLAYDRLIKQEKELSEIYKIIKKDLDLAASIQEHMFPKEAPRIDHYSLAVTCKMAKESGGDFYDIIRLNDHKYLLVIGDVSGKGLPASLYMSSCINIIRALVEEINQPEKGLLTKILKKINKLLFNIMRGDSFITLFLILLDTSSHTLSYLSSGHMPALVFDPREKTISSLNTPGIACGVIDPESFAENLQEQTIAAKKGNYYILYTDGITDSLNSRGVSFGERFYTVISGLSGNEPPGGVINILLEDIAAFTGDTPQYDDITLLCFKRID